MRTYALAISIALFAAAIGYGIYVWSNTGPPPSRHGQLEFRPAVVFNRAQSAITDIPIKPVREIQDDDPELPPNTLVLGVTVNGESRAYPLNQLVGPTREIFNDELGGRAIMPTW